MTSKGYIAQCAGLEFYNAKALINMIFVFNYLNEDNEEVDFDFPGYVSSYLRIYDARQEQLIKNFTTQVTRNSNVLVFNCSVLDMTFQDIGPYFYEIGYNRSGYEVALRFGKLTII